MKRIAILILAVVLLAGLVATPVLAAKGGKNAGCTTLQDGVLTYSAGHYLEGEPIPVGYDIFGYNYQAHMFNGYYANIYLGRDGFPPYEGNTDAYLAENPDAASHWAWPNRDIELLMKWNDAWLSNKDCDNDGLLDRHYGFASYIGSGAWRTNHQWGSYEDDGQTYKWDYFCKIVAVPADAVLVDGMWNTVEGTEIGPNIGGEFAIIQEVYNEQGTSGHGVYYNAPAPTGLGYYTP